MLVQKYPDFGSQILGGDLFGHKEVGMCHTERWIWGIYRQKVTNIRPSFETQVDISRNTKHDYHWRTQWWYSSGVDPGFPVGGSADLQGGANKQFSQIFQKTAWNWDNFGPQGALPPDPPLLICSNSFSKNLGWCHLKCSHHLWTHKTAPE